MYKQNVYARNLAIVVGIMAFVVILLFIGLTVSRGNKLISTVEITQKSPEINEITRNHRKSLEIMKSRNQKSVCSPLVFKV